jgi:hypothetical protein
MEQVEIIELRALTMKDGFKNPYQRTEVQDHYNREKSKCCDVNGSAKLGLKRDFRARKKKQCLLPSERVLRIV